MPRMKVACAYTGRSMSQPVLLTYLHDEYGIDLHLFKDHAGPADLIDFDYEHYSLDVSDVELLGQTALWATQHKVRNRWRDFLEEHIDSSFDLVIGMNDVATPAIDAAKIADIPSIFFLRNLSVSGQEMYSTDQGYIANFLDVDLGAKAQYPYFVRNLRAYSRGMQEADRVITNSGYVSDRVGSDFGVESEVVYPPIVLDKYRVEYDPDGYIGMVNPRNRDKGGDIFLDIVAATPSEEFLSAGVFRDPELERRAEKLDNLRHMGWCDDMKAFYEKTKLVIVPSRCEEAFGRAAAEPMISGIPCVVSDRGGLPEVVGSTGEIVTNIESIPDWQTAIRSALANHDPEAQVQRVKRFSASSQGEKFHSVIDSIL